MKKTSIETLLLLSSVCNRKQISDLFKDIRSLDADQIETVLVRLDDYKSKASVAVTEAISEALEKQRAEAEKLRETSGTAQEILHLLLTRYKLKVPVAAKQLSEELARKGHHFTYDGGATKANFGKWLKQLCERMPREEVMSAALNLNTSRG